MYSRELNLSHESNHTSEISRKVKANQLLKFNKTSQHFLNIFETQNRFKTLNIKFLANLSFDQEFLKIKLDIDHNLLSNLHLDPVGFKATVLFKKQLSDSDNFIMKLYFDPIEIFIMFLVFINFLF